MANIQIIPESHLKRLLQEHGIIARTRSGQLVRVENDRSAAKSSPGGNSIIYSHYDGETYICTAHKKVVTAAGQVVHCDAKRFIVGDNDFRTPPKP